MWVSCNLILLNLSDNFFYIVYFCLYLSISIKLSLLHTHYYRIIIHYFSTFLALPFFLGTCRLFPIIALLPTNILYKLFLLFQLYLSFGAPVVCSLLLPYYQQIFSTNSLSLSLSLSLLQLYSQLTSHYLRHLSNIFQFLNNIIHIFTHFFTYTYFQKSKNNVTRTTLPNGLVVAKKNK